MDNVNKFLLDLNINKDEKIVVAVSGGPDSMFLLYLLNSLGYKCIAAHINHKLRIESDDEYKMVSNYCSKNGIVFEGTELTGYTSGNFENYARKFRYDFFEKILKKHNSSYLFTAHHGDDLIETVLMRLVRGSSIKGYAGFSSITKKKDYSIIRPLVYLTKDEIEDKISKYNIPYAIDNTNNEDEYTRNRYRHHVLPFLKKEDKDVHLRFLHFSNELKEENDYIMRVVNKYLDNNYKDNVLDITNFKLEDDFIKRKIIFRILEILYPDNLYLVSNNNIVEILKLINSNKPNLDLILPNNIIVKKEYNKIIFDIINLVSESYKYELDDELEVNDYIIKNVKKSNNTSNYCIRLNSKDIKLPIIVRSRIDGDKITVKNMTGTKKINDIFIDSKISKSNRDVWPIVCDSDNNILWVPGLKKSNFDVPINDEYDIILEYVKKEKR